MSRRSTIQLQDSPARRRQRSDHPRAADRRLTMDPKAGTVRILRSPTPTPEKETFRRPRHISQPRCRATRAGSLAEKPLRQQARPRPTTGPTLSVFRSVATQGTENPEAPLQREPNPGEV